MSVINVLADWASGDYSYYRHHRPHLTAHSSLCTRPRPSGSATRLPRQLCTGPHHKSLPWSAAATINSAVQGSSPRSRVLAVLLHGTLVVGVSQTLRHWTEGATYIRQGGHHVGHWPTFLVNVMRCNLIGHLV